MKLGHIGIWTNKLEELKVFYVKYFGATTGEKYINPQKNFASYFLSFQGETTLELMQMPDVRPRPYDRSEKPTGLTHMAFAVESKEEVDRLTDRLQDDGYDIASLPRMTGDGFYESAVFDPDNNIVEITCCLKEQ
jgi:lactoylglutathione lyase